MLFFIMIVVIVFVIFLFNALRLGKQEDVLMEKLFAIKEDEIILNHLEEYTKADKRYKRIKDLEEDRVQTKLFKNNKEEIDILKSLEEIKKIYKKDTEDIQKTL